MDEELSARLLDADARMADRVEELESELATLRSRVAAAPRPDAGANGPTTDRRHLLRALGVAAGGAVVGAGVVGATPAAATDGQSLIVGQTNTAGPPGTQLLHTSNTPPPSGTILRVADQEASQYASNTVALAGCAYGNAVDVGVYGYSEASGGLGVVAVSEGGVGLRAHGEVANLLLDPTGVPPQERVNDGQVGLVMVDTEGDLWVCVEAAGSGTWRRLTGATTTGGLTLLPTPVRVYDSRPGKAPLGVQKGQMVANDQRTIDLTPAADLMDSSAAAVVNVTVTGTSSGGFLKVWGSGPPPSASSINWFQAGSSMANGATVALDAGTIQVRCGGTGAATDVIIDVTGYYA